MPDAFVVGGVRTPIGRYGGVLASVRPDDLAALVVREVLTRSGVAPGNVDEVVLGCANQAGEDNRNVARMAALLAGLPDELPAYTVNRLCASGLTAITSAADAVRAGAADIVIAGGVESMTRAPWVMAKPGTPWARPGEIADTSLGWRFTNPAFAAADAGAAPGGRQVTLPMGETADEVAALDGIGRAESDAFALESHRRAVAAVDAGRFAAEIVAVPTGGGAVATDEGPRRDTSAERLAGLRPAFRSGGVVTAGSSSGLADGAAAVIVASGDAVRRHGLAARARVAGHAAAGVAPQLMGLGPVPATERALARAGWAVDSVGAVELNEAFAVQSLAVVRRLGLDPARVNRDGGAIALGHPLGCSGARIVVTLLGRMQREQTARGLATMCVGVGQGVALLLERA